MGCYPMPGVFPDRCEPVRWMNAHRFAGESRSGGRNACCRVRPHILSPSLRLSFCAPSRMIRTSPPCAPSARHHAAHLTPPSEHKMPVAFQDYYATLGITREATDDDVKKGLPQAGSPYHPDVAKDKKTAEEKMFVLVEQQVCSCRSTRRGQSSCVTRSIR